MNDYTQIIERLQRLERQANMAIETVKSGLITSMYYWRDQHDTPNTFRVGDFIVVDRQWTACGPKGCGCGDRENK